MWIGPVFGCWGPGDGWSWDLSDRKFVPVHQVSFWKGFWGETSYKLHLPPVSEGILNPAPSKKVISENPPPSKDALCLALGGVSPFFPKSIWRLCKEKHQSCTDPAKSTASNKNTLFRKVPVPVKIQLAFPPLPKKLHNTRTVMGMGVFQQKEPKMPGAHKIGAAVSGPRHTSQKTLQT